MKALVTGATGFVGSAVVRKLLAAGFEVRALVRPGSDRRNLDGLEIELVPGDLGDRASLARAAAGCRALFHLAADYRLWVPDPDTMMRANVEGSRNIVRAAAEAGVSRIVYTSSVAVLKAGTDGSVADEDAPTAFRDMIGAYKQSKFLAEEAVRRLAVEEGAPVVIVNPSTPVGAGDLRPTPTGRLVVEAARGRMKAYVDTGLNIVHVDDVATGHLLACERGVVGERYILGGENMSLGEILAVIARLSGRRPPALCIPRGVAFPIAWLAEHVARALGQGEPLATVDGVRMARHKMYYSSARAARELGYHARPAEDALREAVAWFTENGYVSQPSCVSASLVRT
jgi:dihydroflavonol-4-reductase